MKKITLVLMFLVSFLGFAQFPLPYCGPMTFTNNVEPITLVNFAGINSSSAALVGANNGTTIIAHEDYTAVSGNVIVGSSTNPIILKGNTDGTFTTYFRVYIDWNQNSDFTDAGESYDIGTIYNSTGTDATQLTGNIIVPMTALTGTTRMRVVKRFNAYPTGPCQTGAGYGQAEDYTLTVAPLPPDLPDYVNLQWPLTANINAGGSVTVYGQVYEPGVTDAAGQGAGINAWVGISPIGSDTNPNTWTNWVPATYNVDDGNNDEYQANIGAGLAAGTYYYATRFQLNGGGYVYGGLNFGIWDGTTHPSGVLTVNPAANDECSGAIALTVNPDYLCGTVTPGSVLGATASSVDATACGGTEDDDVWYSFVATATSHRISLLNVTGTDTDMYHSLWTGADCNSLSLVAGSCSDANTSNPVGLTIGQTYYLRVYTYGSIAGLNTTYNICIGTPPPPPANDECSGAIALTVNPDFACGTVTPGTVAGATASSTDATACLGAEDDDVWFSFVATSTAHRISILNVAGSVTDMFHSLWTGADCNSLTLVTGSCSDADTSNRTGLTIGTTYYVRVNTYTATGGQTTTFNICIGTPPPPPTNDNFANAAAISCGNSYTGSTDLATLDEDNAPDGFGTDMDAPNVWYSYTGSGSAETVNLSLCGSAYDSSVLVYTGTSGNLTLVAANDDDNSCAVPPATTSTRSKVSFNSDGTTTYYIAIEGWNVASIGTYVMDVTCSAVNPPAVANQNCDTALDVLVDGNDNLSDNSYGDVSAAQPSCDLFGSIQDVWFSFTAPASGLVTCMVSPGSMTSLNFNIYSGACGSLTPVTGTCNADLASAGSESLTGLIAGNTYYVQVWSNATEQGTFTLRLSDDGLGNADFDSSNFSFYPNPVKNVLNLSYIKEISNVEIFNLLGQRVSANKFGTNTAQVDMSHLSNGAYMVKVTADGQTKTIKVIKQ